MKFQLSLPGKTYLLGEYLTLLGGPALLLNSSPRFVLTIAENPDNSLFYHNFPENSLAVKFMEKYANFFRQYSLAFTDPYCGLGGFGASSAQFGMVAAFKNYNENKKLNYLKIIEEYQSLLPNRHRYLPSGADIVAQLCGGVTYFYRNKNKIEKLVWPFPELSFALIHTGNKIATDKHLENLQKFEQSHFEKIVAAGYGAMQSGNSQDFCEAINSYGKEMLAQDLVSLHTQQLLSVIKNNKFILAAKGCGALASDVILTIFEKKFTLDFYEFIKKENLNLINIDNQTKDGLLVKQEMRNNNIYVILVDEQDQQIGIAEKQAAHQKGQLHRAYSIFIFRKNHGAIEVLLQQRALGKYHTGGLWSNTCCSHPAPGEDILLSAKKRLQQEMGISADLYEIGAFCYKADLHNGLVEHEYDHVFMGKYQDDQIITDKDEIDDYQWMPVNELLESIKANPEKYTPWLQQALELTLSKNVLISFKM